MKIGDTVLVPITVAGLEVNLFLIDPGLAGTFIRNSISNQRKLSEHNVNKFVRMMNAGQFCVAHDAIVIYKGKCCNGQHRLQSIVRTGKPHVFIVLSTNDERILDIIDTCKPRSIADVLTMEGIKNAKGVAAAGCIVNSCKKGAPIVMAKGRRETVKQTSTIDRLQQLEFCRQHNEPLAKSLLEVRAISRANPDHHIPESVAAASHYLFAEKDGKKAANEYISGLMSGNDCVLVQKAIRIRFQKDNASKDEKMAPGKKLWIIYQGYKCYRKDGKLPGKTADCLEPKENDRVLQL